MTPPWRFVVLLLVAFSLLSLHETSAQAGGTLLVASDLQLLSLGEVDGGGHVRWTLTGSPARALRGKVLSMFDEQLTIPRGFSFAAQATGATAATVNNGRIDSEEAGQFLNYLENELEGVFRAFSGTEFRFVTITRADRAERDLPAERSSAGLVGTTNMTSADVEIRFIFNANTRASQGVFPQASEAFAQALHHVFAFDATEDLRAPGCPPLCYPFPAGDGWRRVDSPPNASWPAGPFLWHGDVGAIPWVDVGAYPPDASNVTFYSPDGAVEGAVDLRFAVFANLTFEHTGGAAAGDVLLVQLSTDRVAWRNLTAVNDGDGQPAVDVLPITTLRTSVYNLTAWLGSRVYVRLNFTANGDGVRDGPGFFLRNLRIQGPSRFEGLIDHRHIDFVVGFLSFSDLRSPNVSPHVIRTPVGEIVFYNAAYESGRPPQDVARFATFDVLENPQVLFVLLAVSAWLIGLFEGRAYERFRLKHPRSLRPYARKEPWLHWTRRGLVALLILLYFFPTLFGANLFVSGPTSWALSVGFVVGMATLNTVWYARRAKVIPHESTVEPVESPSDELPPPPPSLDVSAVAPPQERQMIAVRCPSCGETQMAEEGGDLALVRCNACGGVLKDIPKGYNYLVIAKDPRVAYEWFRTVVRQGVRGLCMSTTFPEKVRREYGLPDAEMYWISDTSPGPRTLDPNRLDFEIMRALSNFVRDNRGGALVLDGLEYLIVENSFDRVLKFIKKVNDLASVHGCTMFVPVTPTGLGPEEMTLLRKEFDKVEIIGVHEG